MNNTNFGYPQNQQGAGSNPPPYPQSYPQGQMGFGGTHPQQMGYNMTAPAPNQFSGYPPQQQQNNLTAGPIQGAQGHLSGAMGGNPGGYVGHQGSAPSSSSSSNSTPRTRLTVKLSDRERGFYSGLLQQADPTHSNRLKTNDAKNFLVRAQGLNTDMLKKIWVIASSDGQNLDRDQFYVAMRLIAYAQNNLDVSPEAIMANVPVAMPVINPKVTHSEHEDPAMTPHPPNQDPHAPHSQSMGMVVGGENAAYGPGGALGNQATYSSPTVTTGDPYSIPVDYIPKYESYFDMSDQKKKGSIGGQEVKAILTKSGLPNAVLGQIWTLCDRGKKGSLTQGEFIISLHLMSLAKQGTPIPPTLPYSLESFLKNMEVSSSNNTVGGGYMPSPSPTHPIISSAPPLINPGNNLMIDDFSLKSSNPNDQYSCLDNLEVIPTKVEPVQAKSNEKPPVITSNNPEINSVRHSAPNSNANSGINFPPPTVNTNNATPNLQANNDDKSITHGYSSSSSSSQQVQTHINDFKKNIDLSLNSFEGNLKEANKKMAASNDSVEEVQQILNNALSKLRDVHTSILQQKEKDLDRLGQIHNAYTILNKRIQQQTDHLSKETEDLNQKKQEAVTSLIKLGQELGENITSNIEAQNQLINISQDSIQEISQASQQILLSQPQPSPSTSNPSQSPPIVQYHQPSSSSSSSASNNHNPSTSQNNQSFSPILSVESRHQTDDNSTKFPGASKEQSQNLQTKPFHNSPTEIQLDLQSRGGPHSGIVASNMNTAIPSPVVAPISAPPSHLNQNQTGYPPNSHFQPSTNSPNYPPTHSSPTIPPNTLSNNQFFPPNQYPGVQQTHQYPSNQQAFSTKPNQMDFLDQDPPSNEKVDIQIDVNSMFQQSNSGGGGAQNTGWDQFDSNFGISETSETKNKPAGEGFNEFAWN